MLINRIESSSNPHSSTSSSFKYVTFTAMWQKVLKQGKFSVSEAHFIHKSERKKNHAVYENLPRILFTVDSLVYVSLSS